MQLESRSRNVHTLGPVAGSFQHKLLLRGKVSEAVILVSRVFAFVFSWYKVIIALSLCFSTGPLQHTVHKSIVAAKIFSLNFFQAPIFRSRLKACSNKHSNTNPFNTKCRLQTNTAIPIRSIQNAGEVQNAD